VFVVSVNTSGRLRIALELRARPSAASGMEAEVSEPLQPSLLNPHAGGDQSGGRTKLKA